MVPLGDPGSFQSAGRIWGFWNNGDLHDVALLIDVSIRRADLGLLEPQARASPPRCPRCFNPPGGFGAFGTSLLRDLRAQQGMFQSAGRIWGFWNMVSPSTPIAPAGRFQSAGRIWGFWN